MPFSILPEYLPWADHNACLIIDGHGHQDLEGTLARLSPAAPAMALFALTPLEPIKDLSPWAVAIDGPQDPVLAQFLSLNASLSGWLCFTLQDVFAVAAHLRKLVTVKTSAGVEVLLRLDCPGVIDALFRSLEPASPLFGPIELICVTDHRHRCWQRHWAKTPRSHNLNAPYTLTAKQENELDLIDRHRLVRQLDEHREAFFPEAAVHLTVEQRWAELDKLIDQAYRLGLGNPSDLLQYLNSQTWLRHSTAVQQAEVAALLSTPSTYSPTERVNLAARLALMYARESTEAAENIDKDSA